MMDLHCLHSAGGTIQASLLWQETMDLRRPRRTGSYV